MKMIIRIIQLCYLVLLQATLYAQATNGTTAQRLKEYNISAGKAAIDGYDPVAYFKHNKAVEGREEHSYTHNGITYRFSNAANLSAFQKEPSRYEPQYGGWCAYAMGHNGSKVSVDPESFRILDGKLYLFYNSVFNNTRKTWMQSEPELKKKADANWSSHIK
jgi:YHS domain-containing protein